MEINIAYNAKVKTFVLCSVRFANFPPDPDEDAEKEKIYNDFGIKSERIHTINQLLVKSLTIV